MSFFCILRILPLTSLYLLITTGYSIHELLHLGCPVLHWLSHDTFKHTHSPIVLDLIDSFIIHPNTIQKPELSSTCPSFLPHQHSIYLSIHPSINQSIVSQSINHHVQNLSVISSVSISIHHLYTGPNNLMIHLSVFSIIPLEFILQNLSKTIYLKFKSKHIIPHLNTFKNYT